MYKAFVEIQEEVIYDTHMSNSDVSKFVKDVLVKSGNCIEVTMNPEGNFVQEAAKASAQPAKKAAAKKDATKKGGKKGKSRRK